MRPIAYYLLFAWDRFFSRINWKIITEAIIWAGISVFIGLSIIAFQAFGLALLAIIAFCIALALVAGPLMWLLEKICPNSPIFQRQKMPESFRQDLIEAMQHDNNQEGLNAQTQT